MHAAAPVGSRPGRSPERPRLDARLPAARAAAGRRRARPLRGDGERPERAHHGLASRSPGWRSTTRRPCTPGSTDLRRELNVYRGHVIEVALTPSRRRLARLRRDPRDRAGGRRAPEAVLARVERHALGVAAHRDALLAAGQHLKRGLLLYGPPGTGKTHTTRYLVGQMRGYTRLRAHRPRAAGDRRRGRARARSAAGRARPRGRRPVAEDRSFGPGSSPVLFDLLDAMDGAAGGRGPAVRAHDQPCRPARAGAGGAARPGRRRRSRSTSPTPTRAGGCSRSTAARCALQLTEAETLEVVERTEGVTASFLKELLRRAVLEALQDARRSQDVALPSPPRTPRARSTTCSTAASRSRAACSASATTPRSFPPAGAWARCRRSLGWPSAAVPLPACA